jgi:lipopolysaccharide exporter
MKERSYWLASGSYSILQRLISILFGFGSYFFLTRYFPVESFGVWALFILITSLVEMVRTAFIQNAFIKFYSEPDIDSGALFSSSLLLNLLSTLFFILLLIIAIPLLESFWHTAEIGAMILWYCGASVILVFFTQLNFLEQANHQFKGVFWGNVTRQGILFLSIFICYLFIPNLSLTFFSFIYFCSTTTGLLVSFYITRNFLPKSFRIRREYLKKLGRFGRYILGVGITSSLGKYFDQFLLGSINLGAVALYNACVRVINMIEIPVLSIATVSYPKLANTSDQDDSVEALARLYEKTVAGALSFILPSIVIVLLLPEFILTLIAGKKYIAGADSLRILTASIFLLPFNVQFGNVCEIINKPQVNFIVNLFANLISVSLNLYYIKTYGATGAAFVFSFTLLFTFVIGQTYLKRKINIRHINIVSQIPVFYKSAFETVWNKLRNRSRYA